MYYMYVQRPVAGRIKEAVNGVWNWKGHGELRGLSEPKSEGPRAPPDSQSSRRRSKQTQLSPELNKNVFLKKDLQGVRRVQSDVISPFQKEKVWGEMVYVDLIVTK